MINGTTKVFCNCPSDFQDSRYGKGMRVANATQRTTTVDKVEVRCTVCGKIHQVNKSKVK